MSVTRNAAKTLTPALFHPMGLLHDDAASRAYIFNWSTKGLSAGTYRLSVNLDDGLSRVVNVGLK